MAVISQSSSERIEVTFGVDSGAEVTVISLDTASDYPRERGPKNALRDCTGKPMEDLDDEYFARDLLETRL